MRAATDNAALSRIRSAGRSNTHDHPADAPPRDRLIRSQQRECQRRHRRKQAGDDHESSDEALPPDRDVGDSGHGVRIEETQYPRSAGDGVGRRGGDDHGFRERQRDARDRAGHQEREDDVPGIGGEAGNPDPCLHRSDGPIDVSEADPELRRRHQDHERRAQTRCAILGPQRNHRQAQGRPHRGDTGKDDRARRLRWIWNEPPVSVRRSAARRLARSTTNRARPPGGRNTKRPRRLESARRHSS